MSSIPVKIVRAILKDPTNPDMIKVSVEQIFALAEAAKAQEVSQHGHPHGKLVLQVVHPSL